MREQGWEGARYGSKHKTTIADDSHPRYPDLVDRNFCAPAPNRLWVADFTYVPTWTGLSTSRSSSTPSVAGSWAGVQPKR